MRQDARQNRERILVAAEEVFGEHGAAGSTEEVARRAGVGIATVFRHFPTKDELIGAALVRHLVGLTEHARSVADAADPGEALRDLVCVMIETGPTKITLASVALERGALAPAAESARELRAAVGVVLRRAQDVGAVRAAVTVDEVYLLVRGLAQASATMPVPARTLRGATDIVLAGLAEEH